MRKCPKCGEEYDVLSTFCANCGADLPAPYEGYVDDEDEVEEVEEVREEKFANSVPPLLPGVLTALGVGALPDLRAVTFKREELTILSGAAVYLEEEVLATGTVILARGRILEIVDAALPDPENGATFIDLTGKHLAPGFIEIHIHGMMGIDTNQTDTDGFLRVSEAAASHGVTAMTPTTVACPADELERVLRNLKAARERGFPGARLLGLHMESNFISMEFKGAQPPDYIFPPSDPRATDIIELMTQYNNDIRIVTIAPEVDGALGMIEWLVEHNIIASLGHSAANYEQAVAGIAAGARHATHLFNAMGPLHHRNPNLVGAALECDDVYTELVCDGVHIHPAVISTVISAKGAERFVPVSDALQGAGLPEGGEFFLGGQHVTVANGVARLDSGTIAGSITTMDGIVRLLVNRVGWNLGEALYMAATTPANALGLDMLGRIAQDAIADLVVLDDTLEVEMTLVGGKVVYQRG